MADNIKLRVENYASVNGSDNNDGLALGDRQGGLLVSQLNLPLYNAAIRKVLKIGMGVTAGSAVPADNATAPTFALWNPAGSGVNLVPVKFRFGTITLGTRVVSAWAMNINTGLGATIATGSGLTAFASTPTAIKNADFSTATSKAYFSNAGTVTCTATTDFFTMGPHYDLATNGGEAGSGIVDFNGELIVAPGTMIWPCTHAAASGSTYIMQISWLEIPIL